MLERGDAQGSDGAPDRGRWLWPLLVALALFWVFRPLLVDSGLSDRDLVYHYYPLSRLRAATLDSGSPSPGWNPLLNGGMPYAADPLNGVFYPPFLILKLIPDGPTAFSLLIFLHRLGLGLLTFWLARTLLLSRPAALVAGWLACLGGATMSADALQFLYAYTWIPLYLGMLVVHQRNRRPLALAGALAALLLILLAGEPQTFYVLIMITPFFWWGLTAGGSAGAGGPRAFGAGVVRAGILAAAAIAVGAAAMLPLAEFSSLAHRPHINDYSQATVWSFHPWRVIEFLISRPFGLPDGRAWTFWAMPLVRSPFAGFYTKSHYIGVAASFLVLAWPWLAPRSMRRLGFTLSGIAIVALLVGTGDYLDLYAVFYRLAPKWQLFRFPDRMLVHTLWAAALLAGMAVHGLDARWQTARRPGGTTRRLAAGLIAAGALLAIASLLIPTGRIAAAAVPDQRATAEAVIGVTLISGLRRSATILVILGLATLGLDLAARTRPRLRRLCLPLILLALVVDLITANAPLVSFWPNRNLRREPEVLARIASDRESRDAGSRSMRPPQLYSRVREFEQAHGAFDQAANWQFAGRNIPVASGLAAVTGYSSLELERTVDFFQRVPFEQMTRILGVGYLVTVPDDPWMTGRTPLYASVAPPIAAYRLWDVRDPVHLVTRIRHAPDEEGAIREVSTREFDPLTETILIGNASAHPVIGGAATGGAATGGTPTLEPLAVSFDRVAVRVTAADTTAVILTEVAYPGWTVQVDEGPRREPMLADGLVMATVVPAGTHEVVFEFRSRSRRTGLWLSGISVVGIVLVLIIGERRERRAVRQGAASPPRRAESA